MTGQAGVKTGKGSSAVPEGFAALMGTVAIGEAGAAVPPFTLGPDGEPILLGSDDATAEGMADVLGLSLTTEQAGDPTALSMEASFTGLMTAAQPTGEGATAQATGQVTTATTVSAPAVAVPQAFVQGVAGETAPQLPLAAPTLAADAVAANVTQTAVKVAPETAAPAVPSPVEAKTAAPAPQPSAVPQPVAAPTTAVAAQQPIAATAEVQSVAQTQGVAGVQPVPKPQISDKVSTPPRAAPQAVAAVEGTAPPEPSIDADTPVAPLRQAAFGAEQPTFLNAGQNGAATQGKAPVDVTATFRPAEVESNALILADQASDLKAAAPSAETQAKPAPKPFADALISQVKAVEAKEGRTSVSLHPRGLGQIEIEVVTDKDSGTRVVVRVENPAVLQTLRDERQLLAQGLGFTDAGSFEFQQGFSDDGARDQQRSTAGFGGGIDDGAGPVTAGVQHKNVVDDGQLDILT